MEIDLKSTAKGIKVNGKLCTRPSQLLTLFAEYPKGVNRKIRKFLNADGKRMLAATR